MLTGDLLLARTKAKDIYAATLDVDHGGRLERAAELIALVEQALAEGWTRGELVARARDLEGTDTDHKITRGLAKVLMDRCTFEALCPSDPAALRMEVFLRAAAEGPLARHAGPLGRRTGRDLLTEIAGELPIPELPDPGDDDDEEDGPAERPAPAAWTADSLARALYADLKDEQVVTAYAGPTTPRALLQRYNVALYQALLLRGVELTLRLSRPDPKRVRQLFRWLKFQQLMYRVELLDGDLVLQIDGPQSLLSQSTRYGLKLASFFPAVLLQDGPWWLEATVMWGKARKVAKRLRVDHEAGLVSHLRDTGTWRSRTERWFEERFLALDSGWTLRPGELVDLGQQRPLVPDFSFEKDGRIAHLDIVGYWRQGYLDKRIDATPPQVILAVSKRLMGDKSAAARKLPPRLAGRVVPFAEIIPAKDVLALLEQVALPAP